jgi:hypothetical protein
VRVGILWSHWVSLVRGGFWQKRPSNRSSWAKKFCAGVGIPALNVAYNRSLSKSLYCHLTPLEPCTEASQKSSVVGRVRAGMALIAALSGSRRHSSARPALSQPRCTGRDIHSPKSREVKFSRRDGVRPRLVCAEREVNPRSLPIRIVAAQGCTAEVGGCSEHFSYRLTNSSCSRFRPLVPWPRSGALAAQGISAGAE